MLAVKKLSADAKAELFFRRYYNRRLLLVSSYEEECVTKSGNKHYIMKGLIRSHYKTLVIERKWTEAHFVLTLDFLLKNHMLLSRDNFYNVQPRTS